MHALLMLVILMNALLTLVIIMFVVLAAHAFKLPPWDTPTTPGTLPTMTRITPMAAQTVPLEPPGLAVMDGTPRTLSP